MTFSDGTTSSHPNRETYNWKPDGTLIYLLGDDALVLTRSADRKTVEVRSFVPEPKEIAPNITEYTVVLELLVGTHGLVKEARVLQSSGLADVDAMAIERAENNIKLEPFMENGRRVEKRGRFPMKVRVEK
jgi:hypothetical protein